MLDSESKIKIVQLRLMIIRAAQKDSLRWWEDESLTQAGWFLAERLFLMDTAETARKLGMEAAHTRYRMAFGDEKDKLHLFHLDPVDQVDYELRNMRLSDIPMPAEPITSSEMLRQRLLELTGEPAPYQVIDHGPNDQVQIRVKGFSARTPALELAQGLAWACLESQMGKPCFPYFQGI